MAEERSPEPVTEGRGLAEALKRGNWGSEDVMYRFKVELCSTEGDHDWLECPYAHRGEKAARRDPRSHNHIAVICPDIRRSGRCPRGDNCPYAHSVFELHLHPSRYRTALCTMGTSCHRPVCFFAHTQEELRAGAECPTPPPPAPRGLSFDLAADGGAAAAAAMRTAVMHTGPGRSSLDTAAAAAAAAARAPPSAPPTGSGKTRRRSLESAMAAARAMPPRLPNARASFDALGRQARADSGRPPLASQSRLAAARRLSLPTLLPAELGFTASDGDGTPASGETPRADGAGRDGGPQWLLGGAHHPQQMRAAVALLEPGGDGASSGPRASSPLVRGGRRAGLDGGARPRANSWAASAAASELFKPFTAQQQQLLSALAVQQQYEQMAAQQCELLATQRRTQLAAHQPDVEHPQPNQQPQQQQQQPQAAMQQQMTPPQEQQQLLLQAEQLLMAQQQQQQQQQAQQPQQAQQQQQAQQHHDPTTAALAALWLQERRAAAATAAAVAVAQHESNALAALRWSLANQQPVLAPPLLPQQLGGLPGGAGLPDAALAPDIVAAPSPDLLNVAAQLALASPHFL